MQVSASRWTTPRTIYGMNFESMPELHWAGGCPFAILLMAVVCTSLYAIFKKRDRL